MVGMAEIGAPISLDGRQSIRIIGASDCVIFILLQKIQKMAKCTFWYQLTRVVPDKVQRAVKWFCVCVWRDILAQTYCTSLPYSTTVLNVTVIHSCPFCALIWPNLALDAFWKTCGYGYQLYMWLCVCLCSKRKTAWAINTKLGRHAAHSSQLACTDPKVKRSKIKVTQLSNVLHVWVCVSVGLLRFPSSHSTACCRWLQITSGSSWALAFSCLSSLRSSASSSFTRIVTTRSSSGSGCADTVTDTCMLVS